MCMAIVPGGAKLVKGFGCEPAVAVGGGTATKKGQQVFLSRPLLHTEDSMGKIEIRGENRTRPPISTSHKLRTTPTHPPIHPSTYPPHPTPPHPTPPHPTPPHLTPPHPRPTPPLTQCPGKARGVRTRSRGALGTGFRCGSIGRHATGELFRRREPESVGREDG